MVYVYCIYYNITQNHSAVLWLLTWNDFHSILKIFRKYMLMCINTYIYIEKRSGGYTLNC